MDGKSGFRKLINWQKAPFYKSPDKKLTIFFYARIEFLKLRLSVSGMKGINDDLTIVNNIYF